MRVIVAEVGRLSKGIQGVKPLFFLQGSIPDRWSSSFYLGVSSEWVSSCLAMLATTATTLIETTH